MTAGIVLDMPEAEYHSRPELSSTQARLLLQSPARYQHALTHPKPARTVFDVGTAAHTKILGVGSGTIAYPPEHLTPSGNVSTKAATVEWAAAQRANGLTPVTPQQVSEVDAMAEAVLAHPTARVLLEQPGAPEASVFATEAETGVDLRSRFDFLPEPGPRPIAVDVKSAADASPREFARAAANHGYHVQEGHYEDTVEDLIDLAGFVFLVVEKDPPHLVGVYQLEPEFRAAGRAAAARARRVLAECRERGEWPGYPTEVQLLATPYWLIAELETPA
ncbi:PD-(D/E)XK nuclease-like domain-containing protein [Agromyces sp. NPDC058064]|uniref:PD-(D/E)XK nuclease-like domain-containing protein n=1 Tax=Agromyces sp. NPDC058064 TaxID=3346322 RepID=UPI0036DAF8EC